MPDIAGQGPLTKKEVPDYLLGMHLVFHGGKCCGIKTVYNMGNDPDTVNEKIAAIKRNDADQAGGWVSSTTRFFHEEAPAESGLDRLKRYIEYMKRRRPQNMLEVVLAESPYSWSYNQSTKWEPVLFELGFKKVCEAKNSNSGNTCKVYYLVIDDGAPGDDDEDDDCIEDYED